MREGLLTAQPPAPALSGYDLRMGGTPEYQAKMGAALRAVVAAMANTGVPFSHEGIAEQTGLSVAAVHEALSSEECRELLRECCIDRCHAVLNKGVGVAEEIMLEKSEKPEIRLAALRSLTTLYRTLTISAPAHEAGSSEAEIWAMLDELKRPAHKVATVTEETP